jgi:GntR family transcriptional regulator/MocR family aminotransferase
MDDVAVSAQALEHGIVVNALSRHDMCDAPGASGWRGLMLGYAQVPAEQMDDLVTRLAAIVHLAAFAANRSR